MNTAKHAARESVLDEAQGVRDNWSASQNGPQFCLASQAKFSDMVPSDCFEGSEMFKVDLRWEDGRRLSDRVKVNNPEHALEAFRELLRRADLVGQDVAARFVVENRSLYFSRFDQPVGEGRIHPDAPLRANASRDEADSLARWKPGQADGQTPIALADALAPVAKALGQIPADLPDSQPVLTMPGEGGGHEVTLTLGQLREFVRAAQRAASK